MIGNFYYLADAAAGDHGSDDGERGGAQSSFVFLLLTDSSYYCLTLVAQRAEH